MKKNDVIHKIKVLAHTARTYFKGVAPEIMLPQGMRLRVLIMDAMRAGGWTRDPEIKRLIKRHPELGEFRKAAVAEEHRIEEERHQKALEAMERRWKKAVEDFNK